MGLGYHQADIRELEIPTPERMETGLFSVSNGARRFTRYGYADLFQEGRKYNVLFRLWPGTQRHLLWGDPEMAAAYSRTAHFCGAAGLEICEPLTFKGREGSGHPGGRCAYLDKALEPINDWEKFAYTYRIWGRLLYNPDTSPEVWRRSLARQFGPGALAAETAMANASRVLPLITTAHIPSASNHSYWPEIYTNMPIAVNDVDTSYSLNGHTPYSDTPKPYRFGTVSPLDPQLFSTIAEYVDGTIAGRRSPKYSPLTVALWMQGFADKATTALVSLRKDATRRTAPEFRRWEEDLLLQIGLGRFFASKLRSGVAFEIFLKTHNARSGQVALARYTEARDAWSTMAQRAALVYQSDISYGDVRGRRGDWSDRLPAINSDLDAMSEAVKTRPGGGNGKAKTDALIDMVTATPPRPNMTARHMPANSFRPGESLPISLTAVSEIESVQIFYRHVNQGERWLSKPMTKTGQAFAATIAGEYTQSVYPLQYYFELQQTDASVFHPEFDATLSNEPYFVVWHRS